jgi:KDO2-lipid IV(A) lauroyltransferase
VGLRRDVVERQLRASFPSRPETWIQSVVAGCYGHFGRELAALARMGRLRPARLVERTADAREARATWEEATGGRSGGIMVGGHLGNWELAGALLAALGIPVTAAVRSQTNRRVDRRLTRLRRSLGIEPVPLARAGRRLGQVLDEGRAVALVADQDAGRHGVFVPFLGRPASTFRGPARLALRHDVPLLFGAYVREGEGYRLVLERVQADAGPDAGAGAAPDGSAGRSAGGGNAARASDGAGRATSAEDREVRLTRAWVARLEQGVRRRPEQYFWFHRRWKTAPSDGRRSREG